MIFFLLTFQLSSAFAAPPHTSGESSPSDSCANSVPVSARSLEARARVLGTSEHPGTLRIELSKNGLTPGSRVFFRIFKQTPEFPKGVLEAWIQKGTEPIAPYELFKKYPVLAWAGKLGPKLAEGDKQSPEGYYSVTPELMNPLSVLHLGMNIGYPNAYDQSLGRTGSEIMIHGGDVSIGCFAMGNAMVEEIYLLAEAAFLNCVKEIPVTSLPFPMTQSNLDQFKDSPWHEFWENLAEGDAYFETNRLPPAVSVAGHKYHFTDIWGPAPQ